MKSKQLCFSKFCNNKENRKISPFFNLYKDYIDNKFIIFLNKNAIFFKENKKLIKIFKNNFLENISVLFDPYVFDQLQKLKIKNTYQINLQKFLKKNYKKITFKSAQLEKNINLTIKYWIKNNSNFIKRIRLDKKDMIKKFNVDFKIKNIEFDLGDNHNNHNSVILIKFINNKKILYKPRNSDVDIAFNNIIIYLNKILNENFHVLNILNKENYSWHEFLETNYKFEVNTYKNFGKILSLFFFFKGSDLHDENLIMRNNQIIPIDLENISNASKIDFFANITSAEKKALFILESSVQGTSLLPSVFINNNNLDFKGGFLIGRKIYKEKLVWKNNKTINLYPKKEYILKNSPKSNYNFLEISENKKTIIKNEFNKLNKKLLNISKNYEFKYLQKKLYGTFSRFIIRNTYFYNLLIKKRIFLRSNDAFFIKTLEQVYNNLNNKYLKSLFLKSEIKQVYNLDIPYFYSKNAKIYVDDKSITVNKKININKFLNKKFFKNLQNRIIEDKLFLKVKKNLKYKTMHKNLYEIIKGNETSTKKSTTWFNKNFNHKLSDINISQDNLYSGNFGILVFLSAINIKLKSKILQKKIEHKIYEIFAKKLNVNKSGILIGVGSYIYFLLVISNISKIQYDSKYIPKFLKKINFTKLINNNDFDTIDGNSGLIIALVKYYEKYKTSENLKNLKKYGRKIVHKLKHKLLENNSNFLPGYSHGISGLVYAISAYNFYDYNYENEKLILKLLKLENSKFFIKKENNWINLNNKKNYLHNIDRSSWCHGSLGVGISRIGALKYTNNNKIKKIIKIDIKNSLEYNFNKVKNLKNISLCCGSLSLFTLYDYNNKSKIIKKM